MNLPQKAPITNLKFKNVFKLQLNKAEQIKTRDSLGPTKTYTACSNQEMKRGSSAELLMPENHLTNDSQRPRAQLTRPQWEALLGK